MTAMSEASQATIKVRCDTCGGGVRNHAVLSKQTRIVDEDWGYHGEFDYLICSCLGCDSVRFCIASWNTEDLDDEDHPEISFAIYPDSKPTKKMAAHDLLGIDTVGRIYKEAVAAYNAGAHILAGAGLRAVVEGICIERGLTKGTLADRIDLLATNGLLAKPQAELLHEERYLGNAAVHELETPSDPDLVLGFEIVEGLLRTIYVLPARAAQLKAGRLKKQNAVKNTPANP